MAADYEPWPYEPPPRFEGWPVMSREPAGFYEDWPYEPPPGKAS